MDSTAWPSRLGVFVLVTATLGGDAAAQSGGRIRGSGSGGRSDTRAQEEQQLIARSAAAPAPSPRELDFEEVSLPADSRLWRNSAPLSLDSVEGKGVVLYFFEEENQTLAAYWPKLNAVAQEYRGKPVLFVAVNSGNTPSSMGRYLQRNRVGWRVVFDLDRSLENAMGVPTITPEGTVFAVRYIDGEGMLAGGQAADIKATVEAALNGAAWRVEPSTLPGSLSRAWEAVEFGDYAAAAGPITKATQSDDSELRAGGETLLAAVTEELTESVREAVDALKEGDDWAAYKTLDTIASRFGDYELPLVERAKSKHEELASSESITAEIAAAKLLDKAVATGSRGTPAAVRRGKGLLERIVSQHPSTEAANRASDLLAKLER